MEKEKPSKIIQFFGGKTSYYIIGLIILSSLAIYLLNTVSFIFKPLVVIITTVLPPMIFALLLYYLLNPVVNFLSTTHPRHRSHLCGNFRNAFLWRCAAYTGNPKSSARAD